VLGGKPYRTHWDLVALSWARAIGDVRSCDVTQPGSGIAIKTIRSRFIVAPPNARTVGIVVIQCPALQELTRADVADSFSLKFSRLEVCAVHTKKGKPGTRKPRTRRQQQRSNGAGRGAMSGQRNPRGTNSFTKWQFCNLTLTLLASDSTLL